MFLLAKRIAMLVAVAVLVSATPVFAECAWVLWEENLSSPPNIFWLLDSAHPTLKQCQAALVRLGHIMQRDGYDVPGLDLPIGTTLTFKKHGIASAALCLPDTVNPREAKEGGR